MHGLDKDGCEVVCDQRACGGDVIVGAVDEVVREIDGVGAAVEGEGAAVVTAVEDEDLGRAVTLIILTEGLSEVVMLYLLPARERDRRSQRHGVCFSARVAEAD